MSSRVLVRLWLLFAFFLAMSYYGLVKYRESQASMSRANAPLSSSKASQSDGPKLTQFSLTDQKGRQFHSSTLQGKPWVGSFFFASCPSSCFRLNQMLSALQQQTEGTDVQLVSITCDPANDTTAALEAYAKIFKADPDRWHFLRGELEYAQRIGADLFQLGVDRQTHSERAIVFDRAGVHRGSFNLLQPESSKACFELVRKLADEKAAQATTATDSAATAGGAP